ncbi:MAG: signal peptide peptidase SppA [Rhodospirillales bacterium]
MIAPETVLAMRNLRRSLTFWRVAAAAAVIIAAVAGVGRLAGDWAPDHVARVNVYGLIFDDPVRLEAIEALAENKAVQAVIIAVDSPGGEFVGGDRLRRAIARVAEEKPVAAVMGSTGTSAAYMAALGAERIFADSATITGSIGVMLETADITGLLEKIGVKPEAVKSGPLKAQPNPLEPFSSAARATIQTVIDDMHGLFITMVAESRGLSEEKARGLSDGRIYSGAAAQKLNLIDAVGGEDEARAWLAEAHGVSEDLPVVDVEWGEEGPWEDFTASALLDWAAGKPLFSERLSLDGVVSLWHASPR